MNMEGQSHRERPPGVQDAILKINDTDTGAEILRQMGKRGGKATAEKKRVSRNKILKGSQEMMEQANEHILPVDSSEGDYDQPENTH